MLNYMLKSYLAVGFLSATIATTFYPRKKELKKALTDQLTDEEIFIYHEIINERRNIYLGGLAIGMVVSYLYLKYFNRGQLDGMASMAITGVINYFFYNLMPKSKYMVEYLDTVEENKAWLEIYKTMKFAWHGAFLLGLVASYFIKDLL